MAEANIGGGEPQNGGSLDGKTDPDALDEAAIDANVRQGYQSLTEKHRLDAVASFTQASDALDSGSDEQVEATYGEQRRQVGAVEALRMSSIVFSSLLEPEAGSPEDGLEGTELAVAVAQVASKLQELPIAKLRYQGVESDRDTAGLEEQDDLGQSDYYDSVIVAMNRAVWPDWQRGEPSPTGVEVSALALDYDQPAEATE
ncbi:hypothetical protein KA529_03705 [Candidatus Saccharibacteria bacterium]|nr:hypothetical protein [Candidatus Saccharibacteria bacterium]